MNTNEYATISIDTNNNVNIVLNDYSSSNISKLSPYFKKCNNITETHETKTDATAEKTALDHEIADLLDTVKIHSFEIRMVESKDKLPMPGSGNIIYLVPVPRDKEEEFINNVYDEYIWITDEELVPYQGYYESIGTSKPI